MRPSTEGVKRRNTFENSGKSTLGPLKTDVPFVTSHRAGLSGGAPCSILGVTGKLLIPGLLLLLLLLFLLLLLRRLREDDTTGHRVDVHEEVGNGQFSRGIIVPFCRRLTPRPSDAFDEGFEVLYDLPPPGVSWFCCLALWHCFLAFRLLVQHFPYQRVLRGHALASLALRELLAGVAGGEGGGMFTCGQCQCQGVAGHPPGVGSHHQGLVGHGALLRGDLGALHVILA
ncbi:hypothetical protein E2C01_007212 [Portunus trituberculatus]|uniref:Uncharacterized protein n=1 Tax=Portunus trituberculatus TaxID=210409 RepID=A0A5B7CZH2_PORTR|nr:hypothetical protein [Portunus trituberculatus]